MPKELDPVAFVQQKIDRARTAIERVQKARLEANHAEILLVAAIDELEDAIKEK